MGKIVSSTYAQALLKLGQENNNLEKLYSDYKYICGLFKNQSEFKELLISPNVKNIEKKEIIEDVFEDNVCNDFLNFLKVLVDKRRIFYIQDIFNEFEPLYNLHFNIKKAQVVSAFELNETQLLKLKENIEKRFNCKVVLDVEIDKSLIAGMSIKIDNKMIENTIKNKIVKMENQLLKNN